MSFRIFIISLFVVALASAADPTWEFSGKSVAIAAGKQGIGNGHGEIRHDSKGNIYVSVEKEEAGALQVYAPDGTFVRYVPNIKGSLHGFVIRQEDGKDVIYASRLNDSSVIKFTTDGEILLEIPASSFPQDKGKLKLTSVDVAPNGDIYVVDGYGKDWIFVFDKAGTYKTVFGGRGEPLKLLNAHKIFVDQRFDPPRLLICDRGNNRLIHAGLDGSFIGLIADKEKGELARPSSADIWGDYVCLAEIGDNKTKSGGQVTVLDKEGNVVAKLGRNTTENQSNTPKVKPEEWKEGIVTSPHGIMFDANGGIWVTEWNVYGRVLHWEKK